MHKLVLWSRVSFLCLVGLLLAGVYLTLMRNADAQVQGAQGIAINSGGSAVGSFVADTDYSGTTGTGVPSPPPTIDTSAVTNPAPQGVYQSERWGDSTYTIPNLTPGAAYTVRLHFAELYFTSPGQRVFNVSINGAQVLSNFDIVQATGSVDKAIVEEFSAAANSSGQITIQLSDVVEHPKISGIEIIPWTASVPQTPTNLTATPSASKVLLAWSSVAGTTSYNIYRSLTANGEGSTPVATGVTSPSYTDTGLSNGTSYYYKATAVNANGISGYSNEASATPLATTVAFVKTDTTTQGSWKGVYGADGVNIINDTVSYPAYVQVNPSGQSAFTWWGSTSDVRALQKVASTDRIAAGWATGGNLVIDMNLTDAQPHQVGMYCLDLDNYQGGRIQRIDVLEASTGNVLDSQTLSNFTNGVYLIWNIQGHVKLRLTVLNGNGVLSGLFFGPPSAPANNAPPAPTNLTATAGSLSAALAWSGSAGATSYNVYRGTSPGGESGTPLVTGVTGVNYTDSSLVTGQTYYYKVTGLDGAGESARSNEVACTATNGSLAIAINSGGGAVGSFVADTDFSGYTGSAVPSPPPTIDTSGVTNPAPQAVYQSERWGYSTYTIPNLTPGAAYTVRLHFAELYFNAAGQRVFNVSINGTQVLTNFDVFQATGSIDKAIVKEFSIAPDSYGQITIQFNAVIQYPKVSGIEILKWTGSVPQTPGNLSAALGDARVYLNWSAVVGASSYKVYRGTSPGGEGSAPVATGVTGATFIDTGLTDGTTYYYRITAVNGGGESLRSNEASATPVAGVTAFAINSGGSAVGSFVADTDYSGSTGTGAPSPPPTIDTSAVTNPAPQGVYQSERWGDSTYTIPNLTPGAAYTVRLHFAELYFTSPGQRVFNVSINGAQVLSNFDIAQATGSIDKAIVEEFSIAPDNYGQITLQLSDVVQHPKISGIEILKWTGSVPQTPIALSAAPGPAKVTLQWRSVAGASSYNVYRGTTAGGEGSTPAVTGLSGASYVDTSVTNGTPYYYQVTAVNAGVESARSNEASATPTGLLFQDNFTPSAQSNDVNFEYSLNTNAGGRQSGLIAPLTYQEGSPGSYPDAYTQVNNAALGAAQALLLTVAPPSVPSITVSPNHNFVDATTLDVNFDVQPANAQSTVQPAGSDTWAGVQFGPYSTQSPTTAGFAIQLHSNGTYAAFDNGQPLPVGNYSAQSGGPNHVHVRIKAPAFDGSPVVFSLDINAVHKLDYVKADGLSADYIMLDAGFPAGQGVSGTSYNSFANFSVTVPVTP